MSNKPNTSNDPADNLPALHVQEWALDKHQDLIQYVEASSEARKQFKEHTACIDLYCGPGRGFVASTGEFVDGSPLAIAKAANAKGAPFKKFFINDENKEYVKACEERLKKQGVEVTSSVGKAQDNISTIVAKLPNRGLNLAFIDPFDLVPFVTIDELAELKRVDILVHFSLMELNRNVFKYLETKNPKLEAFAPGVFEHVKPVTKQQAFDDVYKYWLSKVQAKGFRVAERHKKVTGPKSAPMYYLVLICRHDLADKIWSTIAGSEPQRSFVFS